MQPTVLFFLLCVAIPIACFSFLAVAIWAKNRRLEREAYYRNETLKKIAESNELSANAALELLREQAKIEVVRRREGLKLGGLVTIAVGLGFLLVFWPTGNRHAIVAGFIPLLVGLALLFYVYVLAPK